MKIGVIGTGRMAQGLMKVLTPHVTGITWGSRTPERVQTLIEEAAYEDVKPGTYAEALERSDIVIHTLWYQDLLPWLEVHQQALSGKILVDIVNPFNDDFSDFVLDWGTSAAEEIQSRLKDTTVVGAFKNTFFKVFDAPVHLGMQSDVYVTSDDQDAKHVVMRLLQPLPFRFLDGGALKNNRTIERMTLFEREIAIREGHYPYVSYRMFGGRDQRVSCHADLHSATRTN